MGNTNYKSGKKASVLNNLQKTGPAMAPLV